MSMSCVHCTAVTTVALTKLVGKLTGQGGNTRDDASAAALQLARVVAFWTNES